VRITTSSAGETMAAGERLGRLLRPGQTVCLYGDLGAGKTTFIKGIARALGIPEREITSASFTIISEHEAPVPLYHIDLYRLEGGADPDAIGLYEYIGGDGVAVIEWADRVSVEDCIRVEISLVSGDARGIIIEGIDEKDWDNLQKGQAGARGDT